MSFDNIISGDFGQIAKLTFIDVDTGAAADISAYTETKEMIFIDPSGTETTKTATFDTDGSDGVIKYTIQNGLFDESGYWKVYGQVQGANTKLTTVKHAFQIK